jgi:hypothetical protein
MGAAVTAPDRVARALESIPPVPWPKHLPFYNPLHANRTECEAFIAAFGIAPRHWTQAEIEAVQTVYFERRSLRDAAAHLGVPVPTLKARIACARRTLRRWQAVRP